MLDTQSIQKAMHAAGKSGGTVRFKPGAHLTGSLFINQALRWTSVKELR
jgi:polygalacturonase